MSTQPKAWKILGLTTTATTLEVGAAVDRLRRAWEPLLTHESPEERALGARKLHEIAQAHEAIKQLTKPRGVDDWGEHMVFFGRLPDGTWGDRLKYHKDVYDGVVPQAGINWPEPKRRLSVLELAVVAPVALFATIEQLCGAIGELSVAVAGALLRAMAATGFAASIAAFAALMFADCAHQDTQHQAALQRQALLAAQAQCAPQALSVPESLRPPVADDRAAQAREATGAMVDHGGDVR